MFLQNKIALVTGGSRGIGRAVSMRLAKEGAAVIVNYNSNTEAAEDVVAQIRAGGGQASAVRADVADLAAVEAMFDTIDLDYPGLDILVNNAGAAAFKPLAEVTASEFDALFATNVRGLFFLTQIAAGRLRDNGRIVNVSSGITRANAAGGSAYSGSKAAVEAFTRCWAAELGGRGITVNTVSPGMVETDMLMAVMPEERRAAAAASTLLGRLGKPEDLADAIVALCGNDGRWITAQNILVNGGMA